MNRDKYDSVYDAETVVDILKKAGYELFNTGDKEFMYSGTGTININNVILDTDEVKEFYIGEEVLSVYLLTCKNDIDVYVESIMYNDIIIFEANGRRLEMK